MSVEENFALLADLSTGDEIHLTDGTVWSCTFQEWSPTIQHVVLIPYSFQQIRDGAYPHNCEIIDDPKIMKGLFEDAVRGGAQVIKGAGVAKSRKRKKKD